MAEQLSKALSLRKAEKLEESNQLLLELLESTPSDPYLNYQVAWSFDVMGKETEAIPFYEQAIHLGLIGADLEGAYLGLGSTYRSIGRYHEAEKIFLKGMEEFPTNNAFKGFYAMVLYNLKRYSEAMNIVLNLLAKTSNDEKIKEYQRAIQFYSDKLDETWLEDGTMLD